MSKQIPLVKTSTRARVPSRVMVDVDSGKTKYADTMSAEQAYKEIAPRIKQWVTAHNLVILAGAGTSISTDENGDSLDANDERYTGKTVYQIWEVCERKLDQSDISLLQEIVGEPSDDFQLERFITKIEMYAQANANDSSKKTASNVEKCKEVRDKIIEIIKEECGLSLHETAPHKKFLRSLMVARNTSRSRVQIYTLNYDTLFEQAGEALNATIVDGFSFTRQPSFHGSNFELDIVKREKNRVHDQENYEEKVFQLTARFLGLEAIR